MEAKLDFLVTALWVVWISVFIVGLLVAHALDKIEELEKRLPDGR